MSFMSYISLCTLLCAPPTVWHKVQLQRCPAAFLYGQRPFQDRVDCILGEQLYYTIDKLETTRSVTESAAVISKAA